MPLEKGKPCAEGAKKRQYRETGGDPDLRHSGAVIQSLEELSEVVNIFMLTTEGAKATLFVTDFDSFNLPTHAILVKVGAFVPTRVSKAQVMSNSLASAAPSATTRRNLLRVRMYL